MVFSDVEDKQVCQFVGLYADHSVEFDLRSSYRILVYAAERFGCAVCHEFNGVAVLRKNPDAVNNPGSPTWSLVKYRLAQADSGYHGMTAPQQELFEQLCAASSFREFINILSEACAPGRAVQLT